MYLLCFIFLELDTRVFSLNVSFEFADNLVYAWVQSHCILRSFVHVSVCILSFGMKFSLKKQR